MAYPIDNTLGDFSCVYNATWIRVMADFMQLTYIEIEWFFTKGSRLNVSYFIHESILQAKP